MRIRSHLLLLTAVVLVPGLLAATVAVTKVRDNARETALRELRETVRATALLVDGEVQRSVGALGALGQSQHLQTGDFAALYAQAAAADRMPDVWTLVLDDSGRQRMNTSLPLGTPLPPPATVERVARALQTQRLVVSDLITGPASGKLLTTVYLPAKPSPIGRFVVAQAFSVDHWAKAGIQPDGRATWIVAIIDRSGRFIWRSHRSAEYLGRQARPELVAAAAAQHTGLIRHATLEGIDSYDAFTHTTLTGWTIAVAAPVPTIEASAIQAVVWLTAGAVMAFGLALLGAIWLARVLLGAIDTASAAARSLGRGEPPLTPRTPVSEVNALNSALGDAAHLLALEQDRRLVVEHERQRLLDNERLAREAAQQANLAKDKFLALLGHELRNPMAAIAGASNVLQRTRGDAAVQERFLGVIQRQNRHMGRIVDDLLDISRMVSGKVALQARPLDLAACVRQCIEALQVSSRSSGQRWRVQTQAVWVQGDPVRLEQIVSNLAVNAMHFSPPGAEVLVRVLAEPQHAVVQVSDCGPGVAPALQAHIFEPFMQGPPPAGQAASGLGIGLALVKQLVALHGGEVAVHAGEGGVGATFRVRLPRITPPGAPAVVAAPAVGTAVKTAVNSTVNSTAETAATTPVGTVADAAAAAQLAGCRVLLVDDNADAREATAQLLRGAGCSVSEAGDGAAAISLALRNVPDVIVLDLGLPDKSGHQVAAEMQALPTLRQVPLIALSGYGQRSDRDAALAAGFAAHLVKPVAMQTLAQAILAQLPPSAALK